MFFGEQLAELSVILAVVLTVGCFFVALFYPYIVADRSRDRVESYSNAGKDQEGGGFSFFRKNEDSKDGRRKSIQETLKQIEDSEKRKAKKKLSLKSQMAQAGIEMTMGKFWMISIGVGLALGFVTLVMGLPVWAPALTFVIGAFGIPRWVVGYLARRRQAKFLNDFADAIDVMVRGLKSGLPIAETVKIIASEISEPVGPEFAEVVDGQKIGITIDQGIERMAERLPIAEVSFLAIVMSIQSKTGGNLSEALANLSKVLRERKRMKNKIRAVSQEAKSSAAIIGALPFMMIGAIYIMSPEYITLLFTTKIGNIALVGCGIWMAIGMATMKKMINFEF